MTAVATRVDPKILRSVVEATVAIIYVKDLDGRFLFINRAFENLVKIDRAEVLGKTDHDLFPSTNAEAFRKNDLAVLAHGGPIEHDELVTVDGVVRNYISLKFPLFDEEGHAYAVCGISTEITKRMRQTEELQRSLSLLEATLESTADGILVVDTAGKIVRFNRRFVELWRIPPEILEPRDDARAIAFVLGQLRDPDAFVKKVRELYEHPSAQSFDTLTFHDDRVFERYSQPQWLMGEVVGRVWSFRDVTKRVLAETHRDRLLADEREARAQAEEAVRMRDEFLSVASHELRTPLMSLGLALEGLERRLASAMDPERVKWAVGLASRQAKRLGALVDTMLDVSRVQTGRMELHLQPVDLHALVTEVVGQLSEDARRGRCPITVSADEAVVGRWDPLRIAQLLTNLLANAIKFGEGAPIAIRISREAEHARVAIEDHGIGIAREAQPMLFERFARGVSARHYGGLGLGLHIARRIAEAHGGTIEMQSELGQGATFTLVVPLAPPTREA